MSEATGISEATINTSINAPKPAERSTLSAPTPNVLETVKAMAETNVVKTRKQILEEQVAGGRKLTLQEAIKPVGKLPLHHKRAWGSAAQSPWKDLGHAIPRIVAKKNDEPTNINQPTDIRPYAKARDEKSA